MTQQELLKYLAYRILCLYSDPDITETAEEKKLRDEFNKGIAVAIKFVEAASRDEICAECGHAKHRSSCRTVSLEAFSQSRNAQTFR